jgi:hypothetical protein
MNNLEIVILVIESIPLSHVLTNDVSLCIFKGKDPLKDVLINFIGIYQHEPKRYKYYCLVFIIEDPS